MQICAICIHQWHILHFSVHFMQRSTQIRLFSYSVLNLNVVTICEFFIWYKIILRYFTGSNINKLEENNKKKTLKFFVLSVALAWNGSHFVRKICYIVCKLLYSETCLNRTSLGPDFMFGIDRCSINIFKQVKQTNISYIGTWYEAWFIQKFRFVQGSV